MRVPWTPLAPSRRERAVRRIGVWLVFSASAALLAAAARAEPFDPVLALGALLGFLAGALAGRSSTGAPVEVGVDHSGALTVRRATVLDNGPEHRLQCIFAAPWLITLKSGTMWVPIWPDSVPGNTYRRLWVHIRWSSGRKPDLSTGMPGQPE